MFEGYYKISRGTGRIVVSLPWLGIALKFAIVFPRGFWRDIWHSSEPLRSELKRTARKPWRVVTSYDTRHWLSFGCEQFVNGIRSAIRSSGLTQNVQERSFYKHATCLELMLLQPTYVSLLGLVNVQLYGKPSTNHKVAYAVGHLALTSIGYFDAHHFDKAWNYTGLEEGRVQLLDYGSSWVQKNLSEGALRLLQRFDPLTICDEYEYYVEWLEGQRKKERNTPERIEERRLHWQRIYAYEEKMLRLSYNIPEGEPLPPELEILLPTISEVY
jgi:hypothetical protein